MSSNSTGQQFMPVFLRRFGNRVVFAAGGLFILLVVFYSWHSDSLGVAGRGGLGHSSSSSHDGLLNDVYNTTLGFEKVFVVGLPTRTDRRDGMLLQAALSDVKLDFIDGVLGKDVVDKAIPVTAPDQKRLSDAVVGSWRAHMNAIHEIVRLNISSALIMEDDVAWDIRLKDQLRNLALSSQALTQPLRGSSSSSAPSYADITYPKPGPNSPDVVPEISLDRLPATVAPKVSPYGDDFGLLWLGHCGMHFPTPDRKQIPKGRVIQLGDETAPQRRYLWSLNQPFTLKEKYPEHTRAVHHVQEGVCSLAYAVTQKAARQLLHEIALKGVTDAFDILLRFYCEGAKGRAYHRCLTVQPSLVNHWKGIGPNSALSDIGNHKGFTDRASADMTRWAVRQNVDALFEGRTDYFDEYPDKEGE